MKHILYILSAFVILGVMAVSCDLTESPQADAGRAIVFGDEVGLRNFTYRFCRTERRQIERKSRRSHLERITQLLIALSVPDINISRQISVVSRHHIAERQTNFCCSRPMLALVVPAGSAIVYVCCLGHIDAERIMRVERLVSLGIQLFANGGRQPFATHLR